MDKKTNSDFMYCKAVGCTLRERCVRYVEGQSLTEGNWWWQNDCGEDHDNFLPLLPKKKVSNPSSQTEV